MTFLARHLVLYRPEYVAGLSKGGIVQYRLGDLRASLFGVRVPILWALDRMHFDFQRDWKGAA